MASLIHFAAITDNAVVEWISEQILYFVFVQGLVAAPRFVVVPAPRPPIIWEAVASGLLSCARLPAIPLRPPTLSIHLFAKMSCGGGDMMRKIYFPNHLFIFSSIASRGTVKRSRDTLTMVSRSASSPFFSMGGNVIAEKARDIFPSIKRRSEI